jgi:hypothetical protein
MLTRVNDLTVPYVTAAIEAHDPFLDHQDAGLEVYVLCLVNMAYLDCSTIFAESFWSTTSR